MAKPNNNGQPKMTPKERKAFLEWFNKQQEDYFWCLKQRDICERYRGQVVVLHDRKILGTGPNTLDAKADAQRRLEAEGARMPPAAEVLLVIIPNHVYLEEDLFAGLYPES